MACLHSGRGEFYTRLSTVQVQAALKYEVQTNKNLTLGVAAHAPGPSTGEAKAGR